MQQLNRMESKLNAIGQGVNFPNDGFRSASTSTRQSGIGSGSTPDGLQSTPSITYTTRRSATSSTLDNIQMDQNKNPQEKTTAYQHLTAPHKVLLWPAIMAFMQDSGGIDMHEVSKMLEQEGTAWFLRLERQKYAQPLPSDTTLFAQPVEPRGSLDGQPSVVFANLNEDRMLRLATSYFDSYHILYPLLDKENFHSTVLPQVINGGFGYGDHASIIALLVFSLGQIAQDGIWAPPIGDTRGGQESGIRGGDAKRPPGLDIFNEARKRTGFVLTHTSLENIQILQLTA